MKSTDAASTYPVCEIFNSLQGEGFFTGTAAIFLRFSGCNRRCSFCDTDFSACEHLTADSIVARLAEAGGGRGRITHLVATGGEPSMWLDDALVGRLKEEGYFIQVETNGSLPLPEAVDWITCSPKTPPYDLGRIDELKVVFSPETADPESLRSRFPAPHSFLQPCSGLNTAETVAYIKAHPWWRLSLQTHKLIDIP